MDRDSHSSLLRVREGGTKKKMERERRKAREGWWKEREKKEEKRKRKNGGVSFCWNYEEQGTRIHVCLVC